MTEFKLFIHDVFVGDPRVLLVMILLLAAPALDWAFGVLRSLRDGTYKADALDVVVRTQYGGRVTPLIILLLLGRIVTVAIPTDLTIPGLDLSFFTLGALAPAILYLGVAIKSILANAPGVADTDIKKAVPEE